jgi:hypothetical protein
MKEIVGPFPARTNNKLLVKEFGSFFALVS